MIKITELSHELIKRKGKSNISIDMTVGRGKDTLFLSKVSNFVYGFDIQKKAIEETKKLLKEFDVTNVKLIEDDHQFVLNYVKENIDLAIYNLGYLPSSDKLIKTNPTSTLSSLKSLLSILNKDGLILIVLYPHNLEEISVIRDFSSSLSSDYDVLEYKILNKKNSPFIIEIKKVVS